MKFANSAAVILSLLCLPTAALAQEVMSAPNPASAGFSPNRLTRIDAWYQAQIDAGAPPAAVVAIARNDKLAYTRATAHHHRDRQTPMRTNGPFSLPLRDKSVGGASVVLL